MFGSEFFTFLNMLDDMFFANFVSSIDHAVLGLTLVLYPNAFWLQKALVSHTTPSAEQTMESSSAFEQVYQDLSTIAFMGAGTTLLSLFLYHILFLHDQRDERVLLRLKMINYAIQVALTVRAIYKADTLSIWLLARLVVDAGMAAWLTTTLMRTRVTQSSYDFKSVQMAVLLEIAYYVSIGYILIMSSSPAENKAQVQVEEESAFWKGDVLVAFSWQGIHLFAMLMVLLWNVERVPTADARILLIQNILFLAVLVRAMFLVPSSRLIQTANQLFLVAHVCLTVLVYKLSGGSSSSVLAKDINRGQDEMSSTEHSSEEVVSTTGIHEKAKVA